MKSHPDNPTDLECAGEYFADAVRVAKSRKKRVDGPPWLKPQLGSAAIRELCALAAASLIEHWKGDYEGC